MPIQTSFVMLVPSHDIVQGRATRPSSENTPPAQPLTFMGGSLGVQYRKTELLVYHRLQVS